MQDIALVRTTDVNLINPSLESYNENCSNSAGGWAHYVAGKVMAIVGVPLIEVLLARLQKSNSLDQIVLATSDWLENEPLVAHVKSIGIRMLDWK